MHWKGLSFLILSFTAIVNSSPALVQNFEDCQKSYNEKIGELVASSGMSVANTVWRILFESFDLNGNLLISASEIILKLSTENLVVASDVRALLPQAQAWIDSANTQDKEKELDFNEFVDLVGESIGQVEKSVRSELDWLNVAEPICLYFNSSIPNIATSIKDLSICIETLKKDQIKTITKVSGRMTINKWKAVFATIDLDKNVTVSLDEIANTLVYYAPALNNSYDKVILSLKKYLQNQTLTKSQFVQSISSLLFGQDGRKAWQDLNSMGELEGKQLFCQVLRQVRDEITVHLRDNEECITSYKKRLARIFGSDSSIAPAYIFALADSNKNGTLTAKQIESFIFSSQHMPIHFGKSPYASSYSLKSFKQILPDQVVILKLNENDSSFELSILSSESLQIWNQFCLTTIHALDSFPTSLTQQSSTSDQTISFNLEFVNDTELLKEINHRLEFAKANKTGDSLLQSLIKSISAYRNLSANFSTIAPKFDNAADFTVAFTPNIQSFPRTAHQLDTTTTTINEFSLAEVVREVINDLKNENETGTHALRDKDVEEDLLHFSSKAKDSDFLPDSLSKEERELYSLLTKYRDSMQETNHLSPSHDSSSTEEVIAATSPNTLREEAQLQQLLEKIINEHSKIN